MTCTAVYYTLTALASTASPNPGPNNTNAICAGGRLLHLPRGRPQLAGLVCRALASAQEAYT